MCVILLHALLYDIPVSVLVVKVLYGAKDYILNIFYSKDKHIYFPFPFQFTK